MTFPHFELSEFIYSDEARKRGIDNSPTFEVVRHLSELTERFLEPLRVAWGKPITITSGFRCPKLNQVVCGSATSVHKIGYAADLVSTGKFEDFRDFVVAFAKKSGIRFDQILLEENKRQRKKWIHVGLYNNNGQQRGQISVMNV